MLFTDFPAIGSEQDLGETGVLAYRMEGGVPAGTSMRPGELGCLTTKMRIKSTTKLGKRSRKPSGIDMEEFPFSLIRLRKNDSLGSVLGFSFFQSAGSGTDESEGRRLTRRCTNPMIINRPPGTPNQGGLFAQLEESYLVGMQPESNIESRIEIRFSFVVIFLICRSFRALRLRCR